MRAGSGAGQVGSAQQASPSAGAHVWAHLAKKQCHLLACAGTAGRALGGVPWVWGCAGGQGRSNSGFPRTLGWERPEHGLGAQRAEPMWPLPAARPRVKRGRLAGPWALRAPCHPRPGLGGSLMPPLALRLSTGVRTPAHTLSSVLWSPEQGSGSGVGSLLVLERSGKGGRGREAQGRQQAQGQRRPPPGPSGGRPTAAYASPAARPSAGAACSCHGRSPAARAVGRARAAGCSGAAAGSSRRQAAGCRRRAGAPSPGQCPEQQVTQRKRMRPAPQARDSSHLAQAAWWRREAIGLAPACSRLHAWAGSSTVSRARAQPRPQITPEVCRGWQCP